ncbi:hypothetical protein AJ80_02711 [Polytolypa hystricis UAMH7299]|uniref:Methyltransferase domain-containing protein n=1 Tax=Polytolypa hystricis (strain UAMH7299) TaxID=1447883 RepID=A0A2B7YQ61_POLH7|nr:hypothetical protein AJ80_02711 [Polytolypa hystricis UAMH7299]
MAGASPNQVEVPVEGQILANGRYIVEVDTATSEGEEEEALQRSQVDSTNICHHRARSKINTSEPASAAGNPDSVLVYPVILFPWLRIPNFGIQLVFESISTRSLSEHVIEDIIENDRRYCNDTYTMPNDESEQTRLSICHQIYLILYEGQLTKIPLSPSISRILDLGTGPGDWAVAIAEQYPDAEVIATDISVFDSDSFTMAPPNLYFQLDDAEHDWSYPHSFDFVHIRGLSGGIQDWPALYKRVFTHIRPGGAVQVSDGDLAAGLLRTLSSAPDSYLSIYLAAVRSAADVAGYPRGLEHLQTSALAAAGFEEIRTYDIDVPVGVWPSDARGKTLGKMALIVLLESLEAVALRLLTKYMGWSAEGVRDLCEKVQAEVVQGEEITGVMRVAVAKRPGPS